MSSASAFTTVLMEVAAEVRRRILDDRASGLPDPKEETHTQNLVSRLARLTKPYGLRVAAREVPKTLESRLLGADVALWVRGPSGVSGLHLQSKRLYRNDSYYDLGHKTKHGRQVDLLIEGAKFFGAGPAYLFYNGLSDTQPAASGCCLLDFSPDRNGVTIAPAAQVEPHIGRPKKYLPRSAVEGVSTPIVCLARCCITTPPNAEDDLAEVLRSWSQVAARERLDVIDVQDAPAYAQPLFQSLAAGVDHVDGDQVHREESQTRESMLAVAVGPGSN